MDAKWGFTSPSEHPAVLAIFGPTAAGKSALAHAAARELDGEIVVADPFQRYQGLEIAADGPTAVQRSEVRYHLVGDLNLTQASSAGAYAKDAHQVIDDILARGRVPIVAGGTGLYLRAAIADLGFPADPPGDVSAAAEADVERDFVAARAELSALAPDVAAHVDLDNPRRVSRALALARSGQASRPVGELWSQRTRHPTLLVAVTRPRDVLAALIDRRVRRELDDGLVNEIGAALDTPGASREALQIIGAREVATFRSGAIDDHELERQLTARTRKLARAQLTWLKKMPGAVAIDLGDGSAEAGLERLLEHWSAAHDGRPTGPVN